MSIIKPVQNHLIMSEKYKTFVECKLKCASWTFEQILSFKNS